MRLFLSAVVVIFTSSVCISESLIPSLHLFSPGDLEYTDVIVKRVGDNLTLVCDLRADLPALFVWNYVAADENSTSLHNYSVERNGSNRSTLIKTDLTLADSGRYVCSSPPFSVTKFILVQQYGRRCARGALSCGERCVLAGAVCDGRADCPGAEDERAALCGHSVCGRPDRLNCSYGGCIPESACCATPHPLCKQHRCCEEYAKHSFTGYDNLEFLPPTEDRHAPDDYGFIQSTIYTVTACALIFMIAVVLLVSAICKMHMKRAALRGYSEAGSRHYAMQYAQRAVLPPCYEPPARPASPAQLSEDVARSPVTEGRGLTTLAAVFGSRYRQVPTQCTDVEMSAIGSHAENERHRLTLQLGRFHLSIPNFRRSSDPRPDTPNVAEINIDDLDIVRLNSNDTYTLNGRTIQLLGGNFENYPLINGNNPPTYNEAIRYKISGPPPQYLSRDRLNRSNSLEARSNVELPPGYEDLSGNNNDVITVSFDNVINGVNNVTNNVTDLTVANANLVDMDTPNEETVTNNAIATVHAIETPNETIRYNDVTDNDNGNVETLDSVIDNLPAIDSDVNANEDVLNMNA